MSYPTNFPATFPTLMLDFANRKALDPRITFTRASTATFYDEETTVKAEENLITSSRSFTGFSRTSTALTVSTNITGPDGEGYARRLSFTNIASYNYDYDNNEVAQSYTFSVWIRRVSGTGTIQITAGASVYTTPSITTSWARYSVTQAMTLGYSQIAGIRCNSSGNNVIEVWGPQLERRTFATGYVETGINPIVNYLPVLMTSATNVPRFDHNPITRESLGLLIEEQRANLLTYSAEFDNAAWNKFQSSVIANANIAPDGTLSADLFTENTATNTHLITVAPSLSAVAHTFSVFYKINGPRKLALYHANSNTGRQFNVNGVQSAGLFNAPSGGATVTEVGNGWYRATITVTAVSGSNEFRFWLVKNSDDTINYSGDGYSGAYLWGAQLEAGAFATSYIPTVAASVTRSADAASMTGTNFSSWYRQDEGTIYAMATPANNLYIPFFQIDDGTANNRILVEGGVDAHLFVAVSGTTQAAIDLGATTGNVQALMACAYKTNDFAGSLNAGTVGTDTSGTIPVVDRARIGANTSGTFTVTIKKIAYYPQRLTNAQLQGLTT